MDFDTSRIAGSSTSLGFLLRDTVDERRVAEVGNAEQEATTTTSRGRIVCAACGHAIAEERDRISVGGTHEHTCVNPHGLVFHIGCFAAASGCRAIGTPTTEFTWFAGFAWNYALCGSCAALLGWRYHGADASFFGLIL